MEYIKHVCRVLHQAGILLRHKQVPLVWRLKCGAASIWQLLGVVAFDVLVPAGLVYVYVANILSFDNYGSKRQQEVDPMQMKATMDSMMSEMLLPVAFYMFCRKLLGQVVLEKEKGMLDYLKMNGMSQVAYNLSYVLHETFVNGPLVCLTLDALIWYRFYREQSAESFVIYAILKLNVGIILYIMGVTAFSLLIAKGFNQAGFAQ